jgi:molybdenum transport protein
MIHFTDSELEQYINEDIPYLDISTYLQKIENKSASLEIITREDVLVSCMEEACRIVTLLGCVVDYYVASKTHAGKGDVLLRFSGDYNDVHKAWRSAQVLLEYSCKMSTYTYNMKKLINQSNKQCELLTTRKTFPMSKKFCIKAIITGGAMPHRLNLSETVVFFDNHRIVYIDNQEFYEQIRKFKINVPEKNIVVESDSFEDAIYLMSYGVDVIQMDKIDINTLIKVVEYKNNKYKHIKILASGGITLNNVQKYAQTGVDGIVTSNVYTCGMANMGTKMKLLV